MNPLKTEGLDDPLSSIVATSICRTGLDMSRKEILLLISLVIPSEESLRSSILALLHQFDVHRLL